MRVSIRDLLILVGKGLGRCVVLKKRTGVRPTARAAIVASRLEDACCDARRAVTIPRRRIMPLLVCETSHWWHVKLRLRQMLALASLLV